MRKSIGGFLVLAMVLICFACETSRDEPEVVCLPTNMTATIIQGIESIKIIADFHYVEGTRLLDHITWSNHQTHIFEHNVSGRLMVVRKVMVKEKVQNELWFEYEGSQVTEVLLIKKHLDYTYLEPIDSTYTGHIAFEYDGMNVTRETTYEVPQEGGSENVVQEAVYAYDEEGNLTSATILHPDGSESNATMTYDSGKHPFSGIIYYFTGASYVNNMVTRSESEHNLDYTYDMDLNAQGYPEIIYENLGSTLSRIIRYTYTCD